MRARLCAVAVACAIAIACGARTGLVAPFATNEHSSEFCVSATYPSGFADVGIAILLDESGSMFGMRWDSASAAMSALVHDGRAAGLAVSLQYFPLPDSCSADAYGLPAVGVALLPSNAQAIDDSLAKQSPHGATPTVPAIGGVITYIRALRFADPGRSMAIALVTDGAPDDCGSTTSGVVSVVKDAAADGILTFVIGLSNGYTEAMNHIAEAGGTGAAILIDANPKSAQAIVDALETFRDTARQCRFAIPSAGAAKITSADLAVTIDIDGTWQDLGIAGCSGGDGFRVDDPSAPKNVFLCPSTCDRVHAKPTSHVTVTAGCGANAREGGVVGETGGECGGRDIHCTKQCGMADEVSPECSFGIWTCPAGTVDVRTCFECPSVPHGCCKANGSYATASCVNGDWVCPPGSVIFGSPGCTPPAVCAPTLPCGIGRWCKQADASCGSKATLGTCVAVGAGCPGDGIAACGCDGNTYADRCAASQASMDLSITAPCIAPSSSFRCGPLFCKSANEVCRKTVDLTKATASDSYACVAESSSCIDGCKPNPNGCSLCDPCPNGKMCNYNCTKSNGDRSLTCNVL